MKTKIKSLVFLCLFGLAFNSIAASPTGTESKFKVTTYKIGSELKLKLNILKPKDLKVKVEIVNDKKEVIYSTFVAKDETKHCFKFDLNDLQDGQYALNIADGNTVEIKQFTISTK